jgi:tetratricopeptide (TPR) repeat protein
MAKKTPKARKSTTDGASRSVSEAELPRPEAMERTMADLARLFQGAAPRGNQKGKAARRRAQELIYDAWEAPRKADRIRLAEEALQLWPDCADAYNLLAEEKSCSVIEACAYLEQGVRAGERALGRKAFKEDAGHFWGILETRPYMRARTGLAECLWQLGEEEEALGHYHEMLRLNPNDNQGIRDVLLTRLLKRGEQEKAAELLQAYADDGSANWLYNRALWLFRERGEGGAADKALREAIDQNPHVPAYLLGKKKVPKQLPDYIGWGDESEAKVYAADAEQIWRETEGARGWLLRASMKRR